MATNINALPHRALYLDPENHKKAEKLKKAGKFDEARKLDEDPSEAHYRLQGLEQTMATTVNELNNRLRQLEQIPVRPDLSPNGDAPVNGKDLNGRDVIWIRRTYQQLIDDAQRVRLASAFERHAEESVPEGKLWLLERQEMALRYRANGRIHAPARDELLTDFTKIIERYKRKADLYPGGNGQLTAHDRAQIARVCNNYPAFVEALLRRHTKSAESAEIERNSKNLVWDTLDKCMYPKFVRQYFVYDDEDDKYKDPWTEGFVKFCLRSPGASGIDAPEWIKIFVEYPNETDALIIAKLDKRIGAVDPSMLSLHNQPDGTVALSIKVDKTWKRVQGAKKEIRLELPNRVVSKDKTPPPAYPLTMQDVYKQMNNKTASYENVEVFQEGVLNWNSIHLGSFNPTKQGSNKDKIDKIDVKQTNWIYQLPAWRVVDEAQLLQRYGRQVHWHDPGARYALAVCATRTTPDLNIPACHGFFEVIVPDDLNYVPVPGELQKFRILPFGFQPPDLPNGTLDKLCTLQNTQPGLLHYPDESAYLSQRQRFAEFFPITKEEFTVLRDHLANFVEKARQGKEVFQPTGNNCARHVQKVYDKVVGQRFYGKFENFVVRLFPDRTNEEVHDNVKAIRKELDDEALKVLSEEVVKHLVTTKDQGEMASLLHLCVNTLADVLKITGTPIASFKITEAEALQKIQALYADNPQKVDEILTDDLQKLITLCFESQQFYKLSVYDAELKEDIIGPIFDFIRNIRSVWWLWLRDFLFSFLCLVLGSWRSISYEKKDGTIKTVNALNHAYHGRVMHLPAKAFDRPKMMDEQYDAVYAILSRLTNSRRSS